MKNYINYFFVIALLISVAGCNKDEDAAPEPTINHVGEKWNIVSVEYTLIDQNLTGGSQVANSGTATNAGAFYFNAGKGTFEIQIGNTHKEDYYAYTDNGADVSITTITQSVGGNSFSQNVIAISGSKTSSTTMTLTGTITKQSMTGQFVLTGTYTLQKN
jgi:hypothetical protein